MISDMKNLPVDTYEFIEERRNERYKSPDTIEGKNEFKNLICGIEFVIYLLGELLQWL